MDKKFLNYIFQITIFLFFITKSQSRGILDYSHEINSKLQIQAGALSSINHIIPFSYKKLKICDVKKLKKGEDNLGELLTGERIFNTEYLAFTAKNTLCNTLCLNKFDEKTTDLIKSLIERKYFINWYLDKLPAGLLEYDIDDQKTKIDYFTGIPIGYEKNDLYYIYNHLQFHILLNKIKTKDDSEKYNIVGFNILPISIRHNESEALCSKKFGKDILNNFYKTPQVLTDQVNILFTYDVIYEYSNITLALRWDHYKPSNKSIHWMGIFISQSIIFFLSIVIFLVLTKVITRDIDLYNNQIINLELVNEYTWKSLAGDVFRPPSKNKMLLSSIIGTGFQLFLMLTITLCLATFGFLNPEQRTNILSTGIIFYCLMGLPGGYISSKIYTLFNGKYWLVNTILNSVIFPGTLLFGYCFINIILSIENSSAAVNILDIFSLFFLWLFCTTPLILIGSFLGIKSKKIKIPCKYNKIPTFIPKKPWYLHYKFLTFITGIISFGTVFLEFYYVMSALWKHQIYFMATFLWISLLTFILVCGEVSIIIVYFNLCYGDYNWWWKSFLMGGSPVIYFVLYSIYYFFTMQIRRLSAMVVYFGIMGLISAMSVFICGGMSVLMTFIFLKVIYTKVQHSIK